MGKSKNDDLGFDDWFNDGDLGGDDGGAAQRAREEEEAKAKAAEAEAKRKADAARAEAEAKRKAAEEEAKRKAAEEEAKRKAAEEEARRKAAEEEARRKAAEEEAKRKAAEEARLKAEAEAARARAEAEAARARAEEEARLKAAEEARRRAAEEEAKRKAAEEEAKRKAAEEAARARALEDDWFGSGEADSAPAAQPTQAEPVAAPPVAAPPVVAAPIVPQPAAQAPAAAVEEEEEEFEATADSFVDTQPDQTMVLRREGRDGAGDEVATALAAREAWRAQNATTNLAEAQPEPEAAPAETGEAMVESLPDSAAEPVDAPQPSGPTLAPPPTVVEEVEAALPVAVGQSSPAAEATARWSEAAAILEAEGNAASDNTLRATLLAEAGRIHWSKLSQAEEAEKLLGQAVAAGVLLPPVLKAFGDTVAHRGDFGLLRQVLELRAQHSGYAVAAEALQDAALVERNVLKQDAAAVALLDKAITLVPDDWFTLRLLRETHYRTRNWDGLCATLARMAALVSGPRAARYLVERGRIFEEQLGQSAEARAAYEAAFEADPGFAPAFLAVERQALGGGDVERLARLYAAEAARLQGADAGFWWARAARCGMRAGLDAAWVDDAVSRAIRTSPIDPIELRHEHQVWLAAHERHEDLLGALRDELDRTAPEARAPLLALIGALEEKVHGVDQATEVLTAALYDFSAMDPLLDTLERLLGQAGRHAELAAVFETHGSHVSDPASVVSLSYRLGELCEGALGDLDRARAAYARVLEVAPGYLPALDGLERVFSRQSAWEPLLEQYLHRAALAADDSAGQALHLHRAAVLAEFRIGDAGRARDLYKQAMERNASFKPSLEAYVRLLEQEGDFAALADALVRASQGAEDGNEVVGHTYRAARLYADRLARPDQAISCLRRCLELSPGFLPAIALLRQLCEASGAWRDAYELHRQEAESLENPTRRHWRMLAAAEAATHLPDVDPASVAQEILSEDPTHGGALSLLERRAIQTDDSAALVEVYRRAAAGASPQTAARLAVRVADLSRDSGDATGAITAATEALSLEVEGRPLRAIARLCESVHYWEEACRALSATGSDADTVEIARIQETYVGDAATSAAAWRKVLEIDPTNTEAAAGMERSLTRLGQRDGLGDAHAILAENLPDDAIRNVHALLAGHLFEAEGDAERAIRYYRMAFEARPAWGKAFDGLRRLFVSAGDADALEALFAALPDASQAELAAALEDAGHAARAAELYRSEIGTRLADDPELLPLTLHLELCLTEVEDWRGVFETVTLRMPYLRSPEQRQAAEARRRWVLAEKLAETEEAWEHYRALYKDSPNDPEILVPLARIAAARGEIDLAVEYLQGLTRNTADRAEAARYQRQIAEILTNKGDLEGARQAWLLALDLLPEDLDALAGLKALAVREENWQGLVGVLAREATMLDRADRVARYREIASIWEDRLQNSAVAIDAWRKVNEVAGPDGEALQHLVALTRDQADWPSFVEVARQQLDLLSGAERSALLHEMGQVYLDQLHNESEAIQYLEAASAATPPELGAAALLERIYAGRGEWERAIQAIRRQASGAEPTEAVALLQRAAGIALDTLHDQDAAAGLYAEVLALDPVNADALRFRGTWLYKAGDLAGAVEVWGHLEGLDGERDLDDFDTRMELSLYYYRFAEAERQLDRTEAALTHYGRALELNPGHLPSLEAVGPLYISAQSWDKAGEVYRQILQLTGGQGDVEKIAQTYVNLGTVESRLGDLDKAKKRFLKALDLRPNHLGALVGMAEVLFAREDWNNLLNTYNLIIYHSQEPSRVVDAYLAKGFVLDAKMNLMEKAVQHYEKSLAFDAGQPVALLRLAEISLRRRDWAAAAGHVDRALGGNVARADVRGGLHLVRAIAAVATGNTEVSNGAFTAALEADPSLADRLGLSPGTVDQMHAVLRERLRASL